VLFDGGRVFNIGVSIGVVPLSAIGHPEPFDMWLERHAPVRPRRRATVPPQPVPAT
jgi:hypothetical protein